MIDKKPEVTVLMTVYKSAEFLPESVESILDQTYRDFEFLIIVEYGATEDVIQCTKSYAKKDNRIRLVFNEIRYGLAASLNRGIREANGKYIARMDDDDISVPERLEKQISFMERNSDIGLCGTLQTTILRDRESILYCAHEPEELKGEMLFGCQLSHTSIVLRKDLFINNCWEYPTDKLAEDYYLWLEILDKVKMANIPEPLVKHRFGFGNISIDKGNALVNENICNIREHLEKYFQLNIDEYPIKLFYAWRNSFTISDGTERLFLLERGIELLKKLQNRNKELRFIDEKSLERVLLKRFDWLLRRLNILDLKSSMLQKKIHGIDEINTINAKTIIPKKSRVIIYGMGKRYTEILKEYGIERFYADFDVLGCSDSKKDRDPLNRADYIRIENLNNSFDYVLISTTRYYEEIKRELMEKYGISCKKIKLLAQCFLSQSRSGAGE